MTAPHLGNNILIIDAYEVTRIGYDSLIKTWNKNIQVIGTDSFKDGLRRAKRGPWMAIIIELFNLERDGFEVLDQMLLSHLNCPILVCTKIEDESFGIRVIKRGAAGFICKSAGAQEILNALDCVLSGRKYISASLSQKLINQIQPGYSGQLHDALSDREFQVLQKLAQGVSTKEMAAQMSLSAKTVSTYRVRVMKKLGVNNLVELVEYCVENGMTKKQTS